jgi:hypothetical protein
MLALVVGTMLLLEPQSKAGVFIGLPLPVPVFYGPAYYPPGYYYGPYGYTYYAHPYWHRRYRARGHWCYR